MKSGPDGDWTRDNKVKSQALCQTELRALIKQMKYNVAISLNLKLSALAGIWTRVAGSTGPHDSPYTTRA